MSSAQIYTGTVIALAFGGQGIIRHEGLVVFVPFAAIGDKLTFQIVTSKKNYAQGRIVDILEPSPQRVKPKCPYFGRCGGCQLQHLDYPAQLEAKRVWVEEALQRVGGWQEASVPPVVPALSVWHYRRRVAFHLKPTERGYDLGYVSTDNQTIIVVDQCPIFVDEHDPLLKELKRIVQQFDNRGIKEGRLNVLKIEEGKYILDFHFTSLPHNIEKVLGKRENIPDSIVGITVAAPSRSLKYGTIEANLVVDGIEFTYSPKTFMQNHPDQSLLIYQEVIRQIQEPGTVLDLYCGIGISSLLLARSGRRVVGVESNADAVKLAQQSAKANGIKRTEFLHDDVAEVLGSLLAKENPSCVIVNPPREGLADSVRQVLKDAAPPRIIYVSCMPSTLARDLKALEYHPEAVMAYDMFPQTTHVETILTLSKK